ncbi:hypothetical protein L228DRAFT_240591 [Xylona heveae TC161]|uniref:Biogenesis of lysosome-related organelles complex 1 subunit CNL1 n=1 Tax=Xylona heveae (strain CBS 132557 / TC161) TaxID=1328760 RepID=A0A165FDJ0_XYLHT|nr:hypothetical protein L228DRAFT_240591 [Xylona heveae TC161]KZF20856.1 hypothetical protein L228DRAFT_240591 [Xylona heveae TC161]
MPPAPPAPSSIPDNRLGLSPDEVQILRRHQQIALSQAGAGRGRASSTSSSRATTSNASSGGGGRLLLDPGSLSVLAAHFDRLMAAIQARVQMLTAQTQIATQAQYGRASNAMAHADAEIARFRDILRQIDELEVEFDKVRHIRDIVKGFRSRVEALDRRVGR